MTELIFLGELSL